MQSGSKMAFSPRQWAKGWMLWRPLRVMRAPSPFPGVSLRCTKRESETREADRDTLPRVLEAGRICAFGPRAVETSLSALSFLPRFPFCVVVAVDSVCSLSASRCTFGGRPLVVAVESDSTEASLGRFFGGRPRPGFFCGGLGSAGRSSCTGSDSSIPPTAPSSISTSSSFGIICIELSSTLFIAVSSSTYPLVVTSPFISPML